LLLLIFVMILFAGYRIRLPFFLGEIAPASAGPEPGAQLAHHQGVTQIQMVLQTDNPRQGLQLQSQQLLQHKVGCETARPALESQTSQVQTISAGLQNLQLEDASEKEELSVEDMINTKREEELTRIASLKHEKTSAVTRFDDSLLNARSETCESGVTSSEPRVLQPELSSSGVVCETADKTADSQRNSVDIPSAKAASSSRTTDSLAEEDIEDKCQALDLRIFRTMSSTTPPQTPERKESCERDEFSPLDEARLLASPQSKAFISKVYETLDNSETEP